MNRKFKCVICGKNYVGFGNNPRPVKNKGECCDSCNFRFVVPARILELKRSEIDKKHGNKKI